MMQRSAGAAALCVLAFALQGGVFALEPAHPAKKNLRADCEAPGYFKTKDSTGACGVSHCTSTAGAAPYCPCPITYKDISSDRKGSVCECLLGPVCGNTCPAGYSGNGTKCKATAASALRAATGGFQITLMNMGAPAKYAAVFAQAASKWESIITADLTDFAAADAPSDGWFGGYFKGGDYFGPVDDIVIGFR
eukprot:8603-Heterococcus_DN1.PRE.1